MNIPNSFEYEDLYANRIPKYITVLEQFEHHYTGTKMFRVRIEYTGAVFKSPVVEYETWTEQQMGYALASAISEAKE